MKRFIGTLLFLGLFIGGCSQLTGSMEEQENFSELKSYVRQIDDVPRRDAMLKLVVSMEHSVIELQNEFIAFLDTSRGMLKNYDTTRQSMDQVHFKWTETRRQLQNQIIDTQYDLKALATATEWKEIAKRQLSGFDKLEKQTRID